MKKSKYITDPTQHIGLQLCQKVKELLDNFFSSESAKSPKSPIVYFGYLKLYKNGDCTGVSSHLDWAEAFINHKIFLEPFFSYDTLQSFGKRIINWQDFSSTESYYHALKQYAKVDYGVSLVSPSKDYIESFDFALAPKTLQHQSFWMNHTHTISDFILYFRDKGHKLIQLADNALFRLKKHSPPPNFKHYMGNITHNCLTELSRYYLDHQGHDYLTPREFSCIQCLLKGLSAEETAVALNISKRTIEEYFNNIKLKLNIERKTQIIPTLMQTALHNLLSTSP